MLFDGRNCGPLHSGGRSPRDRERKTGCREYWHTSGQDDWMGCVCGRYFENHSCLLVLLPAGSPGTGTHCAAVWRSRCDVWALVACMAAWPRRKSRGHRLHMANTLFSHYRSAVLSGGARSGTRYGEKGNWRTAVCLPVNPGCVFTIRFAERVRGYDCQCNSVVAIFQGVHRP